MFVHIDYNSSHPIIDQVVAQIKLKVVSGELEAGAQLPSIREMARRLKINPTTVARTYTQLAAEGVLTLRQGQGVFVSEKRSILAPSEVRRIVGEHARQMLVEGLRLGLGKSEIDQIVKEELANIRARRTNHE
jgi:GntR family transcriptional regulator